MIKFSDVLITVVFLLALAIPGFIFAKNKTFGKGASEVFSNLVLYGCQPVLIVTSFSRCAFTLERGFNMLIVAAVAAAIHILFFVVLKFVFIRQKDDDGIRIIKYVSVFSNCGFMGMPFLQSLFSDGNMQAEVIIYCAVVIVVFQVLNWTCGVYIITGDKREISAKKILLNPVIISVFIGLALFLILQRPVAELFPENTLASKILTKLMGSLGYISDMVTPLSMIVIGIRLANVSLKDLFLNKRAYISTAIKLVVMPVVTIFCVSYLPIAATVKYTLFFLLSMPSATSGVMMAVRYGKDGDLASVCVLLSTVLSALTLPPLYLFMNFISNTIL
ncbi:MAG: AEC family transporter [Clostridia bacterium]|nr:AEC family transporter [Clostridia bacterium]